MSRSSLFPAENLRFSRWWRGSYGSLVKRNGRERFVTDSGVPAEFPLIARRLVGVPQCAVCFLHTYIWNDCETSEKVKITVAHRLGENDGVPAVCLLFCSDKYGGCGW